MMRTSKCITENKAKVLRIIFALFFNVFLFFPFSISLFKEMNMEIFVKDFSGTTKPRILKFGTNIKYDRLYCALKNQPYMAYQSLYLSIFLSFQLFFHLISLASISATVFKLYIHNEDNQVYYCKQNQGVEIYFCLLFLYTVFSFFSISQSNVMNMEIFVKDFSGTALTRSLKFDTNIRYDKLYCV